MTENASIRPLCQLSDPLTSSESHVLDLMAKDYSDKEIALERSTTYFTVRDQKQSIYDKLCLEKPHRNKKWALQCAFQLGLIHELSDSEVRELVGDNPYKGLDAFQPEDANLFFGRENFTDYLLEKIANLDRSSRFLALVGASGSGKSSVMRAGVLPALVHNKVPGSADWVIATMYPRNNPFYELEAVLRNVATDYKDEILDLLRRDAYGLVRLSSMILPPDKSLVLVIDQFEELYTLVEKEQYARDFMDTLYAAVTDPRSQIRVFITLRADFLDRPLMYPEFGWLIQNNTVMIAPMTPEELERTITQPARQAHVTFEGGVVAKLVAETNEQPGALPLLEFALAELYDNRVGNKITMQMYDELGGIHKALTQQADKIYQALKPEQQVVARQLFLRLVTPGEGTEDVRRRAQLKELYSIDAEGDILDSTIEFLTANRLLTTDRDPNTGDAVVEVAHEALIREWGLLRIWLDESRNDLRLERLLSIAVTEWENHERDAGYLMRGSRLAQYADWRKEAQLALTATQNTYIDASLAEQEHQAQTELQRQQHEAMLQRRSKRVFQILTVVLFVGILGAIGMTAFAVDRENQATESRITAQLERDKARELALVNNGRAAVADGDYGSALAFALAANDTENPSPQAQAVLADATYNNPVVWKIQGTEMGGMGRIVLHPDGEHFLTVPNTGVNKALREVSTGDIVQQFDPDNPEPVALYGAAISPDGTIAAYGQADAVVVLYDIATGEEIRRLEDEALTDAALDIAFSPDGAFLAVGYATANFGPNNCTGSLVLWNMESFTVERTFELESQCIPNIEYSADGQYVITASSLDSKIFETNGTIDFWDVNSGELVRSLGADGSGHSAVINDIAITQDGRTAVSAGWDNALIFWDVEAEQVLRRVDDAVSNFTFATLALSPDDSTLSLTSSRDLEQIALYDMTTFEQIGTSPEEHWTATRIAFVGDANTMLIADLSGEVLLKDLGFGAENNRVKIEFGDDFPQAPNIFNAYSPDLSRAIFTTLQESAFNTDDAPPVPVIHEIYDLGTGELIVRHEWDDIFNAYYTRWIDDEQAATFVKGGELIVWDVMSGEQIRRLPVPEADKGIWMTQIVGDLVVLPTFYDVSEPGSPIVIFNLQTGEAKIFSEPEHVPALVKLSPDGKTLLSGGKDARLIQWDVESGEIVRELTIFNDWVNVADISADSKQALTIGTGDPYLTLWDIETGEVLQRFNGSSFNNPTAWFTPEGILFSGTDGIRLFDPETGDLIRRYTANNQAGYFIHVLDENNILLRDTENSIRKVKDTYVIWKIDSQEELFDLAQNNRYARELTCEERELYQIEPLCEPEG